MATITLPLDMQSLIFKIYFSEHVLNEMMEGSKIGVLKWFNPSQSLQNMSAEDKGSYQRGYCDFEDLVEDHNLKYLDNDCENCRYYNFPCLNCHEYVFESQIPCQLWSHHVACGSLLEI